MNTLQTKNEPYRFNNYDKGRNMGNRKINRKLKNDHDRLNILSIFRNPIFIFIVSPFLAYQCFFNFMLSVLNFSYIFSSIIFCISLFFLAIPLLEALSILKNNSAYFFTRRIEL